MVLKEREIKSIEIAEGIFRFEDQINSYWKKETV